jgi:hypothetical protein
MVELILSFALAKALSLETPAPVKRKMRRTAKPEVLMFEEWGLKQCSTTGTKKPVCPATTTCPVEHRHVLQATTAGVDRATRCASGARGNERLAVQRNGREIEEISRPRSGK